MTQEELNAIIQNHQHWLRKDVPGWEKLRAVFINEDLHDLDLSCSNLNCAYIYKTNLENAQLHKASLFDSVIKYSNLNNADLSHSNLSFTDIVGGTLHHTNLCGTIMVYTLFKNIDLKDIYISDDTIFLHNEFDSAKNIPFIPSACPDTGSFIGWKKVYNKDKEYIVKLEIPKNAKRSSGTNRKCRCNKAKVLEIQNKDGSKADVDFVHSNYDKYFIYEIGKTVHVNLFNNNRWNTCSSGIHFFINREEAVRYNLF